ALGGVRAPVSRTYTCPLWRIRTMEWTLGIERTSNAFRARVLSQGTTRSVNLEYLVSGGLPRERRSRAVIDGDMRNWKQANPAEYLNGFGIAGGAIPPHHHAVYETRNRQRRILIPALTIMRAFF